MATFADATWIDGNSKIAITVETQTLRQIQSGLGAVTMTIRDDGYGSKETRDGAMQLCVRLNAREALDMATELYVIISALADEIEAE